MGDEAMFSLEGKVAVITGGAANLGKATAERFARAGAKVVIGDINEAGKAIAEGLGGLFVACDVSRETDVENLLEAAVGAFGRLDTVINNAGIGRGAYLPDITEEHFDREMAVNTKSVLWGIKHAAPRIADGGAILNTASMAGVIGEFGPRTWPRRPPSSASPRRPPSNSGRAASASTACAPARSNGRREAKTGAS